MWFDSLCHAVAAPPPNKSLRMLSMRRVASSVMHSDHDSFRPSGPSASAEDCVVCHVKDTPFLLLSYSLGNALDQGDSRINFTRKGCGRESVGRSARTAPRFVVLIYSRLICTFHCRRLTSFPLMTDYISGGGDGRD